VDTTKKEVSLDAEKNTRDKNSTTAIGLLSLRNSKRFQDLLSRHSRKQVNETKIRILKEKMT